jgi:hypothetical protein
VDLQGRCRPLTQTEPAPNQPAISAPIRSRSGSETRQRQSALRIRLNEAEHAAVVESAERAGLTLAGYARAVLLATAPLRQSRRPPANKAELAVILGQLGKIGSNVNQLARAANARLPILDDDLSAALAVLVEMRAALMTALGRAP